MRVMAGHMGRGTWDMGHGGKGMWDVTGRVCEVRHEYSFRTQKQMVHAHTMGGIKAPTQVDSLGHPHPGK